MQKHPIDPAQEIKRLQRCMNDLVSVLTLPALWPGGDPLAILTTLTDSLLGMLNLDFLYVRARAEVQGETTEVIRVNQSCPTSLNQHDLVQALNLWLSKNPEDSLTQIQRLFEGGRLSIFRIQIGIEGDVGDMVAGTQRSGFPEQTERLVLSVAANQTAIGLQQLRLLDQQKRLNSELDRRVVERTAALTEANLELTKEIAERREIEKRLMESEALLKKSEAKLWRVIDTIPTLSWCNRPDGSNEFLSNGWHEFTGLSPEEAQGWGWQKAFHAEDLPPLMKRWQELLISGEPGEIEARLRRFDGIYRWFLIRVSPFRDETGSIVRWYGTSTDIEDRKRAEHAVLARERDLKLIINTMPGLAWSARPDGSSDFINQRWLDYTGMSPAQALDWGWAQALHPDDQVRLSEYWLSIIETGESGEIEARLRRFDGSYRWFLFRADPLRDELGAITKWCGTNTDIHDRKLAEEALRANELALLQTINNIPGLVARTNPMGELQFLNRQTLEYFGRSFEEMKGWAIDGTIHPHDVPGVIEARRKSVEEGEVYEYEVRCRRADGVYRWFQVRGGLPTRDTTGSIVSRYVLLIDIEDRKQAEEKLRRNEEFMARAQRLSQSGSFSWFVDTNDVTFSEEARRIFGFELDTPVTLDMIAGRTFPDDLSILAEKIGGARESGGDQDYSIRLQMPDGSIKYLRGSSQGILDGSGRREYVGAIQDVTAPHLAQEALDKARAELAHVSRVTSLSTMAASMAHEINQPLSGIITNASTCLRMLKANPPNVDGAIETAKRTIRDGSRASDVITRLRTLFSNKEVIAEPLDLNETAREVIALILNELQRNGVILQYELADRLPIVKGDRIQLQQVVLNLVRNASDAMREIENRPRRLLIRTQQADENVRVTVEDSGVGFDPTIADRLFESFYTTKAEGMGIGLSVSRSIIEAHGGRLWATANDGPGATFTFSIPYQHST